MLLAQSFATQTAFCVGLSFSQGGGGGSAVCATNSQTKPSAANAHTGHDRSNYANRHQYASPGSQDSQTHTQRKSHTHANGQNKVAISLSVQLIHVKENSHSHH